MKILLDTSAYVGFKRNRTELVEMIINADKVFFSTIVLGELMFGFRNGAKFRENMAELNEFLDCEAVDLIKIGKTTSDRYSRIAAQLKKTGRPFQPTTYGSRHKTWNTALNS